MIKAFFSLMVVLLLGACDESASKHNFSDPTTSKHAVQNPTEPSNPHDLKMLADELGADTPDVSEVQPIKTADGKIQIDLRYLDTKVSPAELSTYVYPIALDSQAVKNYAKAYHITDQQAQHSMVVGMASPEALSKVLDQLRDGKYLSHTLTDGADMTLVINTTPDVIADKFEYVFEGEFGHGLRLPVVIEPMIKNEK